jgi:hypothetical protein
MYNSTMLRKSKFTLIYYIYLLFGSNFKVQSKYKGTRVPGVHTHYPFDLDLNNVALRLQSTHTSSHHFTLYQCTTSPLLSHYVNLA